MSDNNKTEKDLCVVCGEETPYTKDTHIAKREFYIEGAGQMCQKCYMRIYGGQTY